MNTHIKRIVLKDVMAKIVNTKGMPCPTEKQNNQKRGLG